MLAPAPQAFRDMLAATSPQKRLGTIGDIGDAVALFVSDSARWISGQNVVVAGGGK